MNGPYYNNRYNPCKGCQDREIACSDHCIKPEFLEWKAEQKTIRDNRRLYNSIRGYVTEEANKNRRAK